MSYKTVSSIKTFFVFSEDLMFLYESEYNGKVGKNDKKKEKGRRSI